MALDQARLEGLKEKYRTIEPVDSQDAPKEPLADEKVEDEKVPDVEEDK